MDEKKYLCLDVTFFHLYKTTEYYIGVCKLRVHYDLKQKTFFFQIRILLNIHDNTGPSPLKTRSKAKVAAAEKKEKDTKVDLK